MFKGLACFEGKSVINIPGENCMLSSCLKQETSPVQKQIGNVDKTMTTTLEGVLTVTSFCHPVI